MKRIFIITCHFSKGDKHIEIFSGRRDSAKRYDALENKGVYRGKPIRMISWAEATPNARKRYVPCIMEATCAKN